MNRSIKKHTLVLPFVIIGLVFGCGKSAPPAAPPVERVESPRRLISTVPSITEVLFDIGIGDRIVGDSRFTTYPPEAKKIEKIGGMQDTNWEKIVALKPDLLLMLEGKEACGMQAPNSGIETLSVDHRSMEGVFESYDLIGERFGADILRAARARKAALEEKLKAIQAKSAAVKPVRVLLCIDRERKGGRLQNIYVAGTSPYFQDAIRKAGGINVAESTGLDFPNVSNEGILAMNPDVIVDLMITEVVKSVKNSEAQREKEENLIADWKALGNEINAVKTGRIHILTENYATIPGPRTPLFVAKLLEILHGESIKENMLIPPF